MAKGKQAALLALVAVSMVLFVLSGANAAFALTFSGASPANGASVVSPVTLQVEAFASHSDPLWYYADLDPHLVLAATLVVDGGMPIAVTGTYAWEYYWNSPDDWDNVLGFNPGHATYASPALTLAPGSHTAVLNVSETPGSSHPYTWTFTVPGSAPPPPAECTTCHASYPAVHPTDNCSLCHTSSNNPVYSHGGLNGAATLPGCSRNASTCHGGVANHDGTMLDAHTHYDLEGTPFPRNATPCTDCHPAFGAGHATAHSAIEQDGCSACHTTFSDEFLVNHGALDCADCHGGPNAVNPALDYSCGSCHTPSSTPWSLLLGALVALGVLVAPSMRRRPS